MANAIVIYRDKTKKNSWVRWMVARVMRQNKNNLIAVVGKTGSGKTWSAMSIGEMMSKMTGVPFNVDHIVFSPTELMTLINSGKLKRGSVIVCDEFQCSIGARDFQNEMNKVFNFLLSTFRHRNLTLFFCTPFESLLDKTTRKLFHARFEMLSINRNNNTGRLKPRFVEYSDFKAEPYRKQLIVVHKVKGKTTSDKVFYWDVPKPSKDLIEVYEQKKLDFTNRLNKNILTRLHKYNEKHDNITEEQVEVPVNRKELTEKQERVMRAIANSNDYKAVAKELGISESAVCQHRKSAHKKGYNVKEFKENNE